MNIFYFYFLRVEHFNEYIIAGLTSKFTNIRWNCV